jgi:hypothetical protein
MAKRAANMQEAEDETMTGVASVGASTASGLEAGPGASPRATLHSLCSTRFKPKEIRLAPVPTTISQTLCRREHYLHSYPGGSALNFGVFVGQLLLGVAVLGAGPYNVHSFFDGAQRGQVLCLTRLWLDDRLGRNCESRTLAVILRQFRRHQSLVNAVVAYADPGAGHSGTIYRAAGFLYLGRSEATPLYRFPNGEVHHSRSLGHSFGSHGLGHFRSRGVEVELVPQAPKHIYVGLIDRSWQDRLTRPALRFEEG